MKESETSAVFYGLTVNENDLKKCKRRQETTDHDDHDIVLKYFLFLLALIVAVL